MDNVHFGPKGALTTLKECLQSRESGTGVRANNIYIVGYRLLQMVS